MDRPRRTAAAAVLSALGGWAIVFVLAVGPLLTGTRLPGSIRAVGAAVAVAVGLRATGAVAAGRWTPAVPVVPGVLLALLLLQGWAMTAVPRSRYDPATGRLLVTATEVGNPAVGTVDGATSAEAMGRATAVAAVFAACCGMLRDRRWAARLLAGIAAGGVGVAALGLLARAGVVFDALEPVSHQDGVTPFGPFAYHGNAGAVLNVALSAALGGLAVTRRPAGRVAAVVAAAACVAAAAVNVSKAGQVLTGVTLLAWGAGWATSGRRWDRRATVAGVLATVAVVGVGRADLSRWHGLGREVATDGPRATLWRICLGLARSAGPLGYGPGSFKLLLPHAPGIESLYAKFVVTTYQPGRPVSMWSNAHDDLLQTAIEWGWAGAAGWAAVVVGGLVRAASRRRDAVVLAALVGVGVTCVHSAGDFPFQVFCIALDSAALLAALWPSARQATSATSGRGFPLR